MSSNSHVELFCEEVAEKVKKEKSEKTKQNKTSIEGRRKMLLSSKVRWVSYAGLNWFNHNAVRFSFLFTTRKMYARVCISFPFFLSSMLPVRT